jgi:hypothetical protein
MFDFLILQVQGDRKSGIISNSRNLNFSRYTINSREVNNRESTTAGMLTTAGTPETMETEVADGSSTAVGNCPTAGLHGRNKSRPAAAAQEITGT